MAIGAMGEMSAFSLFPFNAVAGHSRSVNPRPTSLHPGRTWGLLGVALKLSTPCRPLGGGGGVEVDLGMG